MFFNVCANRCYSKSDSGSTDNYCKWSNHILCGWFRYVDIISRFRKYVVNRCDLPISYDQYEWFLHCNSFFLWLFFRFGPDEYYSESDTNDFSIE